MYKVSGIDPEIELRRMLESNQAEMTTLRNRLDVIGPEIRKAFAAPVGSSEYKSAGRLVSERKQMEKRAERVGDNIRRMKHALSIS